MINLKVKDIKAFAKTFSEVSRAVNKRSPLPVLTHVLVRELDSKIELTATDLDMSIKGFADKVETFMEAWGRNLIDAYYRNELKVKPVGLYSKDLFEACVSAKEFGEAIKGMVGEVEFSLEVGGNEGLQRLFVTKGTFSFSVYTLPANEFPEVRISELFPKDCFTVNPETLKQNLSAVLSCVAKGETRTAMTGVLVELRPDFQGELMRLVSTDGRRMVVREMNPCFVYANAGFVERRSGFSEHRKIIIPQRFASETARLCNKKDVPVKIAIEDERIISTFCNGTEICSRLIEGIFPDYKRVLPNDKTFKFFYTDENKKPLIEILSRFAKLPQKKDSPNCITFEFSFSEVFISQDSPGFGIVTEKLSRPFSFVNQFGDEARLRVAMNGKYLLDALDSIEEKEFCMSFQCDTRSFLVSAPGREKDKTVMMPIRIREENCENAEEGKAA